MANIGKALRLPILVRGIILQNSISAGVSSLQIIAKWTEEIKVLDEFHTCYIIILIPFTRNAVHLKGDIKENFIHITQNIYTVRLVQLKELIPKLQS